MGYYFDDRDSAAWSYGGDAARIIELLGARFMGEHPVTPFVWRTFDESGIQADRKAQYLLDFSRRFPGGQNGEIAYAVADLYCPQAKGSGFMVACDGPVQVWLNGEQVFQSGGNQERTHEKCRVDVSLNAGYNRFVWRCERTEIGFGCGFANAMPQWEPCNYVLPYAAFDGEAGILYSAPVDEMAVTDMSVFFGDAAPTALTWFPSATKQPLTASGMFAAWFKGRASRKLPVCDAVTVLVDGKPDAIEPGASHEVLLIGPWDTVTALLQDDAWASMTPPVHIHGSTTPYLVMGPLKSAAPDAIFPCTMGQLVDGAEGTITWRPALTHMALRPYVETKLFGRWTYPLGVTLYGMWQAGHFLDRPVMNDYVTCHASQVVGINDYARYDQEKYGFPGVNQQICWLDALDDCGSFGSLMLECAQPGDPAVRKLADTIGEYMLREQPRTFDGAYCRRDDTIWADDMYMSGPFLIRYSMLTGNMEGMNMCAEQLLKYRELLFMPEKQLMSHMRCLRNMKSNRIPWSRGNGWVLFTLSELLQRLPADHANRTELIAFFRELPAGYLRLQDPSGLWHQILDDPGTYLESSATAMFICAFSRGVRNGWYEAKVCSEIRSAIARAWQGLCEQVIDRNGNLYGVCRGSGFSFSRAYYRTLMWNFNDTHGIGIVMLAGVEYLKLLAEN